MAGGSDRTHFWFRGTESPSPGGRRTGSPSIPRGERCRCCEPPLGRTGWRGRGRSWQLKAPPSAEDRARATRRNRRNSRRFDSGAWSGASGVVPDFESAMTSPYPIVALAGILIVALSLAALLIWVERRLLALWQDRYGPNRVGPFGLLHVVADMIKIFAKDDWLPPFADKAVFI